MTSWSAIVLTGGTNKRFGSDKSAAMLGNQTLLQRVVDAIPKEIAIVVVGEKPDLQRPVTVVREEPALGGPVAAIAAGLKKISTDRVAIFATDMPFAPTLVNQLLVIDADAVMPVDGDGFRQPLAALYKKDALEKALADLALAHNGVLHGESMRNLCDHLQITELPAAQSALIDIDTKEDLAKAHEVL